MSHVDVVICNPVRTPVGVDGGVFSNLTAADLATQVLQGPGTVDVSVITMRRRGSRYGIEIMCMGGGQGLATIFERVA